MSFVCPANVSKLNRSIVSGGIAFFSTYWEEMHISISLCIAFPSPLDNNFPLSLSIRYSQFNFRPCKVLIYNLQMPVNDLVLLLSLLLLLLLLLLLFCYCCCSMSNPCENKKPNVIEPMSARCGQVP